MPRSSSRSSMALATGVDVRRMPSADGLTVTYEVTSAAGKILSTSTIDAAYDCPDAERMTALYFRNYAPRPRLALVR